LGQDDVTLPEIQTRVVEVPREPRVTVDVVEATLQEDGRTHAAALELTVRNEDGTLLKNTQVKIQSDQQSDTLPETVGTNSQGKATTPLTYRQPGQRTISVNQKGNRLGQGEVFLPKIEPRTEIKTVIEKQPVIVPPPVEIGVRSAKVFDDGHIRADLELTIRKDGTALANQTIQVTTDSQSKPTMARTDGQGKVTLSLTYTQPEKRTIVVEQDSQKVGQAEVFLPEVQPPSQPPKRLVRLRVEEGDNKPLIDATVQMSGKSVTANTDGFFETTVDQNAVEVEVTKNGYETPQGESIYKSSFPLDVVGGQVVYFLPPVTLSPVRYSVDLPVTKLREIIPTLFNSDVSLDQLKKLGYQFYVKSSTGEAPAHFTPDRKRVWFSFDSSLNLNPNLNQGSIRIEVRQGNRRQPLWSEQLPFRKTQL
jgi:hypothetical protein